MYVKKNYYKFVMVVLLANEKNKDSSTLSTELIDVNERDNYLFILNDAINYLHNKSINGKIRDAKNEKIKIDYFRALIYAINTANSVYKDKQIDKMESDIELLKNAIISADKSDNFDDEIADESINEIIDFDEKIKKIKDSGV